MIDAMRRRESAEALARIEEASCGLIGRGFNCLSSGKFGLPSYTDIEAWARGGLVVYLLYDRKHGGWDLLGQIDRTNDIAATWANLDALAAAK